MPNCMEILQQIFLRTGLDRKDGHPLYRYRVTAEELNSLRDALKRLFELRGNLQTEVECAAFCLFGAEWFRRNYRSGPWSWDVIFEALDLVGDCRPSTQVTVSEYVRRGLKYWNLRLLSTELMKLYLRTLVCQGGFPIHTLRNDGAGLSRMLKACLRDHERFPTEPLDEVLSRYIHFVPPTLQIGEVRRLTADLVQSIARLRKYSDDALKRGLTRVEFLDQTRSGWEVELPLRVEEPEAQRILLSMLDASKAEPFSRHAFSISTSMVCRTSSAQVVRTLRFPASLTDEEFRRVCRVDDSIELFTRMTGYLQAGDQRVPAISISRSNEKSTFRFTKYNDPSLSGSQAIFEAALVLATGGEEIHRVSLLGGEALPESPWIFTADDSHQLIGVGSVRPRDESVLVALPENCEVCPSEGADTVEQPFTLDGRKVFQITGDVTVLCDELRYRIATKSETNRDCLYELRGKSKRLGTGGSLVWCGAPSVWQIPLQEDCAPSEVPREQLQWKPASGGVWSSNLSDCLGHVKIRVLHDGDTRYLARTIVMPPNTELKVLPGDKTGTGVLRIHGLGSCRLGRVQDENIEISASREDGVVALSVKVLHTRPGLIRIPFEFKNGNTCEVSVVCPTSAISVLNVLGEPIAYTDAFPTDRLDGLTLQVIQPESRVPLIFWPDGSLLIDQMRETNVPGVFEYPLSYIKNYATELLACTDDPDGKVRFGIGHNIAFSPRFTLSVARYSYSLERCKPLPEIDGNEDTTEIRVKEIANGVIRYDECILCVVPLGSPNDLMPSNSIVSIGQGIWVVQHSKYPPGYYLAIASDAHGNSYRPLRFVVKAAELKLATENPTETEPLFWKVMNIHDKAKRLEAWDNYFNDVAPNPAHPDWAQLDDFVNASETLPVTTFEAVAAITRNHLAAARYGILFPHRERLWRRFEQLPFLWSAIPIRGWLATAARCWAFAHSRMTENGMDTEQVDLLIGQARDRFVKEAPNRSPQMASVILAMFASDRFGILFSESLQQLIGRFTLDIRTREHTRLISHHDRFDTRSTWPNFRIDCNQEERDILRSARLMIEDGFKNQWAVLNGPGIAAVRAVYGYGLRADDVSEFKRLRALDPEWYDIANAVAMSVLLNRRCTAEPNFLTDLLENKDS